jgi:zinc/manganese transport system permease protein
VFSSLIIPALAVRQVKRYPLFMAYATGTGAYATGLAISALFDLPTGAVIVWALGGFAIAAGWLVGARSNRSAEVALDRDADLQN